MALNFAYAGRVLIGVVFIWLLLIFFIGGPLLKRTEGDYSLINSENGELILARLSRATSDLDSLKAQNEELRNLLQNYIPLDFQLNKAADLLKENSGLSPSSPGLGAAPVDSNQNLPAFQSPLFSGGSIPSSLFSSSSSVFSSSPLSSVPNLKYEQARRRLEFSYNELWFFLNNQFKNNSSLLQFVNEHRASFMYDLETISDRDYEWRKSELKNLTQSFNNVVDKLQNPVNCATANKLVCRLNKGCGFGCQMHHVSYCMVVALATKRTMILDSNNWRYAPNPNAHGSREPSWNLIFQPLSRTCLTAEGTSRKPWSQGATAQVVDLPIIDSLRPRMDYLPGAIPEQIADKLSLLHGSPIVWFMGQILGFIMRPTPDMKIFLDNAKKRFKFRSPIVGIHVRRTDKVGTEASYHSLAEYMKYAEKYFQQLEIKQQRSGKNTKIERLIYLATDDTSIWRDEIKAFQAKGFTFIGDSQIAKSAGLTSRYSLDSLRNVILDIWLLSESDHLVCTFSSQVCRLAYELMQTRGIDNSNLNEKSRIDWYNAYNSLDDIYYFGGQNAHNQIAILNHEPEPGQIPMKIGDIIGIAGNHWNGWSKGVNRINGKNGLYPGFKTDEKIDIAKFKAFDIVDT